ncbi:MAG: hypothetical protein ABI779_07035 [Acidobacteriota bacterium]
MKRTRRSTDHAPAATRSLATGPENLADLSGRRVEILRARIDELTPAFANAVAEEERLYEEIHALQMQIHEIEHADDPEGSHVIYPEICCNPITITIRSPFEQKRIRFGVGDYDKMKHAGLYPYVGIMAGRIAKALEEIGAVASVDPQRCVSVATYEQRVAWLEAWAAGSSAGGEDDDEE